MSSPQQETPVTIDGLLLIRPDNPLHMEKLLKLAQNAWRVSEIWDDAALANPLAWFTANYANPANMVFDVADGQGMIAFLKTVPGWRAQVYFAAWGREAMRADGLWLRAAQISMMANDLLVVDGFIRQENTRSQRVAERMGMKFRGLIRDAACYNGVKTPLMWYEIDRAGVGLEGYDG